MEHNEYHCQRALGKAFSTLPLPSLTLSEAQPGWPYLRWPLLQGALYN